MKLIHLADTRDGVSIAIGYGHLGRIFSIFSGAVGVVYLSLCLVDYAGGMFAVQKLLNAAPPTATTSTPLVVKRSTGVSTSWLIATGLCHRH